MSTTRCACAVMLIVKESTVLHQVRVQQALAGVL